MSRGGRGEGRAAPRPEGPGTAGARPRAAPAPRREQGGGAKALALALALLPGAAAPAGLDRGRHARKAELSVSVRVVRSTIVRPVAIELARARAGSGAATAFDAAGEPLSVRVVVEEGGAARGGTSWVYVFPDPAPGGSPPGTDR